MFLYGWWQLKQISCWKWGRSGQFRGQSPGEKPSVGAGLYGLACGLAAFKRGLPLPTDIHGRQSPRTDFLRLRLSGLLQTRPLPVKKSMSRTPRPDAALPLPNTEPAVTAPSAAISMRRAWRHLPARERWRLFGLWGLSLLASVGFGLATVIFGWSGMALPFGGVSVFITIYPPLLICLFWALAFGWWWGAIPAYLATLSLALYADMPLAWALLFACANPLGFAVLALGFRAFGSTRGLPTLGAWLFYAQLAFVGAVFSSAGALIWSHTNRLDTIGLLPIWQDWWLGGFLQSLLLGLPLWGFWPRLDRWQQRWAIAKAAAPVDSHRLILRLILAIVFGVIGYGFLTIWLGSSQLSSALNSGDISALPAAATVLRATSWVFFLVFALIAAFVGFFGYQLFVRWSDETGRLVATLEQTNLELEALSRIDTLSGLSNRAAIERVLHDCWARSARFDEPCSLLMIDIDHFKRINDEHGHAAGDHAIRLLATLLRRSVREIDAVGRWGGEEFVAVLPGTTTAGAQELAERIRRELEAQCRAEPAPIAFTISIGVAQRRAADADAAAWLRRADQALYQAKHDGRNRVVLAD